MASKLDVEVPLSALAENSQDSAYNPETFSGLVYRLPELGATVNAFSSGKVVSVGATSVTGARRALESFKGIVERLVGHGSSWMEPFAVVNLVALLDIGTPVDLTKLVVENPTATYNPELFPGAILRPEGGGTLLVYSTGRLIVAGARSWSRARDLLLDFAAQLAG